MLDAMANLAEATNEYYGREPIKAIISIIALSEVNYGLLCTR